VYKLIFLCFLSISTAVYSQSEDGSLNDFLAQYHDSNRDTNRVILLLKIDSIYLYRMPDTKNILDSALLMARQASDLSSSIHYSKGLENANFMIGNSFAEMENMKAAIAVMQQAPGVLKIRLLIMLGERYLFKPGQLKQNTDISYTFITQARKISDSINAPEWIYSSTRLLGKYYFTIGDIQQGKNCFMRMINDYHHLGNEKEEAFWWNELGTYLPDTDETYAEEINAYEQTLSLYQKLNMKSEEPSVLENIAFIHQRHNKLDLAKINYLKSIDVRRALHDKKVFSAYSNLVEINISLGDYRNAIYYALEGLKDKTADKYLVASVYYRQGYAYKALEETVKSLQSYRTALTLLSRRSNLLFPTLKEVINELIQKDSAAEALSLLGEFVIENPPVRIVEKEIVAAALGDCNNALGRYEIAEKYYLDMITLDEDQQRHSKLEISAEGTNAVIMGAEAYYAIGNFYVERKQFHKGESYLKKALKIQLYPPTLSRRSDIYFDLYKVDSAQQKYFAALSDLRIQKQLHDSIFNIAKSRDIEELKIQYETDKKEKNLKVLSARAQLQDKELKASAQTKRFIIILMISLIILTGVVYSRYQIKQKSNKLLQLQRNEINEQNEQLQSALSKQKKLTVEKEWLMKEIHHRVKNNLQIVISLLNVQSDYLDNPSAINAIQESRERMQAIALIHQKLYQTDFGNSIDMKSYIGEMISYLQSFIDSGKIKFDLAIDDLNLDVSQAVPLGLILNEAITNALKYAFPNNSSGDISIQLHQTNYEDIYLKITDSGTGFPENFNFTENKSLGIQLMKLFAEQLDGELTFENNNGAQILLRFKKQLPIDPVSFKEKNDGQSS